MRVLITGAAGFIGSHLMDALVEQNLWGCDNGLTGRWENNEEVVHIDITDRSLFYGWANEAKPELVIHCAASYSDPNLWHRDTETNVAGAINVAAVAKHHNARIFYFQTVLPPISSYAISKIAGEHYLRLSGQPLTVFRLAGIYGPRNLSGAIPTFYRQIKAEEPCTVVEDATRDFVFIEDLVERVSESIRTEMEGPYDIRTGVETPISHIPGMIGEILEVTPYVKLVPRREDDVPHYEMTGTPRVGTPFKEGLRKTVAWYEEHGVGETYTHLKINA